MDMVSKNHLRRFVRSRAGCNLLIFLCFSAALAAGIGYGVYQFSVSAFTATKSEEKITALQLVDAFVTNYSDARATFGNADAPVPATFRAHSIELFNAARSSDNVLRPALGGPDRPRDRHAAGGCRDGRRHRGLCPDAGSQAGLDLSSGRWSARLPHRLSLIASQQSCVDCITGSAPTSRAGT